MKIKTGGGYYDNSLGMVGLPDQEIEVADDFMERFMAAVADSPEPTHILISPEVAKMIRAEMDKL